MQGTEIYLCIIFIIILCCYFRNIKRYSLGEKDSYLNALNAIGYCVGKLSKELQVYFSDFALFVEDINITPQVRHSFVVFMFHWIFCSKTIVLYTSYLKGGG